MSKPILLNADLGEGAQVESLLMPHLSYCNIACGGHYGDDTSMRNAVDIAVKHEVKIGAHPSYPDKENFGRIVLDISLEDLEIALKEQLTNFKKVCHAANACIHHVKAHGALYHQIVLHKPIRASFLKVVSDELGDIKIMLPAHVSATELGLEESKVIYEAFGDRRYTDQLQLLSRSEKGAVLDSLKDIENQITILIKDGMIISDTDTAHAIRFDTICLHGDHPQLKTYLPILIQNLQIKGILQ